MKKINLVHHHLLYQACVGGSCYTATKLKKFLYDLVALLDMKILIQPQLKFSNQKAWTGLVGIVTSHISFHFWTSEKLVQLDIYSCKAFNRDAAIKFLDKFWLATNIKVIFIDRGDVIGFKVEEIKHG